MMGQYTQGLQSGKILALENFMPSIPIVAAQPKPLGPFIITMCNILGNMDSFPRGNVSYLSFIPISSPKTVGTTFPVTIIARKVDGSLDTTFNGYVNLSCQGVGLDKASVPLTNGAWSGPFTIKYGEGANLVIKAGGAACRGKAIPSAPRERPAQWATFTAW